MSTSVIYMCTIVHLISEIWFLSAIIALNAKPVMWWEVYFEWTIQIHWQHWTHKTQDEDKQNTKTQQKKNHTAVLNWEITDKKIISIFFRSTRIILVLRKKNILMINIFQVLLVNHITILLIWNIYLTFRSCWHLWLSSYFHVIQQSYVTLTEVVWILYFAMMNKMWLDINFILVILRKFSDYFNN